MTTLLDSQSNRPYNEDVAKQNFLKLHRDAAVDACGGEVVSSIENSAETLTLAFLDLARKAIAAETTPGSVAESIHAFAETVYGQANSVNLNPKKALEAIHAATAYLSLRTPAENVVADAKKVAQKISES